MTKKELENLKRQLEKDKQRFLASLSEEKRAEMERQAEIDLPEFLRHPRKRQAKRLQ